MGDAQAARSAGATGSRETGSPVGEGRKGRGFHGVEQGEASSHEISRVVDGSGEIVDATPSETESVIVAGITNPNPPVIAAPAMNIRSLLSIPGAEPTLIPS